MIGIKIPMPKNCLDCPMSYWVRTGRYEGMLMCCAKEMNLSSNTEPDDDLTGKCIVNEFQNEKPDDCPITEITLPAFCQHCGKPIF